MSSTHSSSTEGDITDAFPPRVPMQLFRDAKGTIRAGPSVNMGSVPRSLKYDPAPDLKRVWAPDMSNWTSLSVEDLRFADIEPAARAIKEENNRVATLTNPYIAELNSIGLADQNSARATELKMSIQYPADYRLTAELLLIPMIQQTQNTALHVNQSKTDQTVYEDVSPPIAAIHDASVAANRCLSLDYYHCFSRPDTIKYRGAEKGETLADILRNIRLSRNVVRTWYSLHALCEDPQLDSESHHRHPSLMRETEESIVDNDLFTDAARVRNRALKAVMRRGWPASATQATMALPATQTFSQTVATQTDSQKGRNAAKTRRQRANRRHSEARELKEESSTADRAPTPLTPEGQVIIQTTNPSIDRPRAVSSTSTMMYPTVASSKPPISEQELAQNHSDGYHTDPEPAALRKRATSMPEKTSSLGSAHDDADLFDCSIHSATDGQQESMAHSSPPSVEYEEEPAGWRLQVGQVDTPRMITVNGKTRSVIDLGPHNATWAESQKRRPRPQDPSTVTPSFDAEEAKKFLARDTQTDNGDSLPIKIHGH